MTSGEVKYVLDANVFMEASRRYYPLDFARPFWDGLISFADRGIVCSIDKVLNEIKAGNDELKVWAESEFIDYFSSTKDEQIVTAYSSIVSWGQSQQQFNQIAKDTFMEESNADTWVLSFALAHSYKIVTHEIFDANIKKRIPIPNVCRAFSIKHCDTFEMLRELNFSF